MKKLLTLIAITSVLAGCSKPTVQISWDLSVTPMENGEYKFYPKLQRTTTQPHAVVLTKVEVEIINLPPLELKPGEVAEDAYHEPEFVKKNKANLDKSGKTITFEISIEGDTETYATNGVLRIE